MANKIIRKTFAIPFGSSAPSTDVEQFGSMETNGTPTYTADPDVIQSLSAWSEGWSSAIITSNHAPYKQDMNAYCLAMSYGLSYLYQMGIPEWDSATPYFTNSFVQSGGNIFISLQDNNLNNTPPVAASNAFWNFLSFERKGTKSLIAEFHVNESNAFVSTIFDGSNGWTNPTVGQGGGFFSGGNLPNQGGVEWTTWAAGSTLLTINIPASLPYRYFEIETDQYLYNLSAYQLNAFYLTGGTNNIQSNLPTIYYNPGTSGNGFSLPFTLKALTSNPGTAFGVNWVSTFNQITAGASNESLFFYNARIYGIF